ncbi:MAG: NADP(H)-dependent aldo-keto reductase [Aliidongia sp.]
MDYVRLGRTDFNVSRVCLGTMTWGEQNTEAEAHRQLSYALDRGVNFIDTAEMYPVPPRGETQGRTESYIGSWLKDAKTRDQVIIATKAAGPLRDMHHIRGGDTHLDRANLRAAVETSLQRLGIDHIDLYQMHWPDRRTTTFGQTAYVHAEDPEEVAIDATLAALDELVKEGKIRAIGVSNETPWGLARYLALAEFRGLPRVASIQNAYNLVNRVFEQGLAEIALREDCGLLAYSPLGGGSLSGKYLNGAKPAGARMTLFTRFTRYNSALGQKAIERYVTLARDNGLDPAQMALAFVHHQAFVTSTIIGATSMDQLKSDVDAFDLKLPPELLQSIAALHAEIPNPCP